MTRPPRSISLLNPGVVGQRPGPVSKEPRPWIGIRFTCAGAYIRVYRNVDGTAYHASCPKCGRRVRFRVGAGGTDQRFFEVSC